MLHDSDVKVCSDIRDRNLGRVNCGLASGDVDTLGKR